MKTLFIIAIVAFMATAGLTNCSQKAVYTSSADSTKLNKEYLTVMRKLADLKKDLKDTEQKIPIYEAKVQKAETKAQKRLKESSDQASKANSANDVKQARRAETKADHAQDAAEDARSARKRLDGFREDIKSLNKAIQKAELRVQELNDSRNRIQENSPKTDRAAKPVSTP